MMRFCYIAFTALLFLLFGCEKPIEINSIASQDVNPSQLVIDTAYVELYPPFAGFAGAQDILIGNDNLLYVADTRANRVVMMNRAGQVLSERTILHPISVAQDSRLDLLVGGEVVAANHDTAGAIFRIHLVSASSDSAHHLDVARIDTIWRELARPARRFPGITVFGDNTWITTRTGPDNSSFIDPDGRVLQFDAKDHFVTPMPGLVTTVGSGIANINKLTGVASFPGMKDFVVTQSSEGIAYGAIWMTYKSAADFVGWLPKFDPANPDDRFTDFIRPNRYLLPEGVTIDRQRRDIFIADAGLDSVFKFNFRGTFKSESFGFHRTGGAMRNPTGLAFFDHVLYVLNGTDGTIIRFRLSTDIPR